MPTTTDTPTSVRHGVARLLEWLTQHPAIPLSSISHVDDISVEIRLPIGRFDALAAAAITADALIASRIEVHNKRLITMITIRGPIYSCGSSALDLVAHVAVYDEARNRLVTSLGVPPLPTARTWIVTAEHLRGLVETASATAGV